MLNIAKLTDKKIYLLLLLLFGLCFQPAFAQNNGSSSEAARPNKRDDRMRPRPAVTHQPNSTPTPTRTNGTNGTSKQSAPAAIPVSPQKIDASVAEALRTGNILLNFDSIDIKTITKIMAELTQKTIIIDKNVGGTITILSSRKVSIQEAWSLYVSALEASGYGIVQSGNAYKLISLPDARKEDMQYVGTKAPIAGSGNVVALILLNNADAELMVNTIRPMVPSPGIVASYAPSNAVVITDNAQNVSRISQIVKQLDSNYKGATLRTYQPKFIRVKELATALQTVFQGTSTSGQAGAVQQVKISAYEPTNTLIVMAPAKEFMQIEAALIDIDTEDRVIRSDEKHFKVHYLRNADAEEVAKSLTSLMEEKKKIVDEIKKEQQGTAESKEADTFVSTKVAADKATNSLLFYITEKEYESLVPMITMLDAEQKQVLITVIVAESNMSNTNEFGAKWHVLDESGFIGGFQGGLDQSGLVQELTSGHFVAGGIGNEMVEVTVGGTTLKVPKIFGILKALETDNNFNLLSAPRIVTHDHKESKLLAAQQLPFATGIKYDNNNQPVISYEYKDVGLDLAVTPHVGQHNQVRLDLKLSVKDLVSWLQQGSGASSTQVPIISTREINNIITLANGQTIVIGGLIDNKTTEVIKRVPILHKIPLLGTLFQDKTLKTENRTLFVFLTPHIINSTAELQQITDMYGRIIHRDRVVNSAVPTVINKATERRK